MDFARAQFISKLERTAALFRELFEKDPHGMIIGYDDREHLKELSRRNEKIIGKLKSREFSVAVVGLEKAGKSTLGNALCTFTTTEIRAGASDEAEIFFYTREEFNANFQKMLSALGYSGNADFDSMNLETFDRYWVAVENDETKRGIFELHNGTTVADIRAILADKNEIRPLLSRSPVKFTGQEEWKSRDFQIYITGIKGKNSDGTIIRGAQPYAVKNVVIHSTGLGKMQHLVLYDVPGFDSPTDLHKKQTEKMLSDADAIILVTNVGDRPNLVGTQLDMLRKIRDADGIRLNEKTFVFGNKIDRAGTPERAEGNRAALLNDAVNKYQIATAERVIVGSAKAYLERNSLLSQDDEERGLTGASQTLGGWNMSDGIQNLHDKMQAYYDTDRTAVLRARAEKILADTEKTLREILEKYTPDVLDRLEIGGDLLLEIKDRVDDFVKKASTFSRSYQNQIAQSKPFSSALIGEIEKIYPLSSEFAQLIEDVENDRVIDIDGNYPLVGVNAKLREDLQIQFMENLVETAASITGDKQKEIRRELVKLFLDVLGTPPASAYREELEKSASELFDEFLKKGGGECVFNSLVERFAVNPIETLILSPFAEQPRYDKVRRSLPELFSLAVYYSTNTANSDGEVPEVEDDPDERMKLFAKILAHEGVENSGGDNPNEQPLRKIFADNKDAVVEGAAFDIESLPYDRWAQMLSNGGVVLNELPKKSFSDFVNTLEDIFYKNAWKNLSLQERIERIDRAIASFVGGQKKSDDTDLGAKLKNLYESSRKFKAVTNKAEMIATLDTDIIILRDVTANAVVKAIGLERAFISVVVKNINLIRNALSRSPEGRKIFNAWINQNVRKIKESEFARIDQSNMNLQTRKLIVESIRQVLDKLEV